MSSILDILNIPFGYILKFCNSLIPNYALTLLVFAVIMKILLFPLGIKQQKSQLKQAALRPKEMAIRKRYAGRDDKATQQKMQQEILDLYQKENYNPTGGCLPLLIQFPVIISLYNVIRNPLTYICRIGDCVAGIKAQLVEMNLLEVTEKGLYKIVSSGNAVSCELDYIQLLRDNFAEISANTDMGGLTFDKLPDFHLFGNFLDLSATPSFDNISWLLAIPVLTFVFAFLSMKLTRKFTYQAPAQEDQANSGLSMKIMDLMMPLFSVYICFIVPAVIGVYWIYQNILGVVQQYALSKMYPIPVFTEEDYKKAEKEMNGSVRKEKKNSEKTRSLHHIDDEEVKAAQKEEQKKLDANRPALKENADGSSPEKKNAGDRPKPRSLHHIDDEDYDEKGNYIGTDEKTIKLLEEEKNEKN